MTQIANNGITQSARGTDVRPDNLAPTPTSTPSQEGGKKFAEHLAPAPKSGTTARPNAKAVAPAAPLVDGKQPAQQPQQTSLKPNPKATNARPLPLENPPTLDTAKKSVAPDRNDTITPRSRAAGKDSPITPNSTDPTPAAPKESLAAPKDSPLPVALASPDKPAQPDTAAPVTDLHDKLQEMLGNNAELMMQQSPALALLSGRLDLIDAAQIPEIVTQSPLLQGILGAPQTADAFQEVMPLQQTLQILGVLPADLPASDTAIQIPGVTDPIPGNKPLKMADTLKVLGFDVPRMTQEGDLLRDTISLEGLKPYMERADRMRAAIGTPLDFAALNPTTGKAEKSETKTEIPLIGAYQPVDPNLNNRLAAPAPKKQPDAVQLWSMLPERPQLLPFTVLDDGSDAPVFLSPEASADPSRDPFIDQGAPFDLSQITKNDKALPTPPSMDNVPLVMNVLPRAPAAVQDPFLALAQRWNPDTVQTLRPEDLGLRDLAETSSQDQGQPLRSLDDLLSRQMIQAPDFNARVDAPLATRDAPSIEINNLQINIQDFGSSKDDKGGDLAGGQQNQSPLSQDASNLFSPNNNTTQGPSKAFTLQAPMAQAPTAPMQPHSMQEIFDKSSMLIKDGGGSIRVDLGSKEMGPLDLALDINGKTVELRIVAHSDQAREALVQELPKLRESLQSHHLNLDKVEIGLSYNSAWSQSSGNGRQDRQQVMEDWSQSSSRGPSGIRGSGRSYRQTIGGVSETGRVPLHNGMIQVRV